jgi:hypothetical protein
MSNGSGLFSNESPLKPHLIQGASGIPGEIGDLRRDILETMGPMSAFTVEEFTNLTASDDDAIKLSIASSASAANYSTTALDGVVGTATMSPPRNIIITSSSHADIDAVGVVITGKDINGAALTETITLTNGGGVVNAGVKAFASVSLIHVPAQSGTGGALKFGFGNVIGLAKKLKARANVSALLREIVGNAVAQAPADFAVSEYTDPVAPDAAGLKIATATTVAPQTVLAAALLAPGVAALLAYPRNVTFTTAGVTASDAPATALITGTDINGDVLTETVTIAQTATIAQGVKAFKTIVSIVYAAADGTGATVAIGFGKKFGLTSPVKFRAGVLKGIQEIAIGAVVTSGTLADATTSPPNGSYSPSADPDGSNDYAVYYEATASAGAAMVAAATSAPNGTYAPSVAPNGTRDYCIYYEYDPTA